MDIEIRNVPTWYACADQSFILVVTMEIGINRQYHYTYIQKEKLPTP